MTDTKTKYNFWITLKKFGIVLAEVLIAMAFSMWAQSAWFMAIAPILEAIRNFLEHCKK